MQADVSIHIKKRRRKAKRSPRVRTSDKHHAMPLEIRSASDRFVRMQASNDLVLDHYRTIITAEGLHDWWEGYQQHRTVNRQHGPIIDELRGVKSDPMIGLATRVDFTPQLEVEAYVFDPETWSDIEARTLTGPSLEFVELETEERVMDGETVKIFHRLSSEPEHTGLAIVDVPAVPGAAFLEARISPNWQYAVVDPAVLNGEVTDPAVIERLRWLPHHDLATRQVTQTGASALASLATLEMPKEATLTLEQVLERARQHMARHDRGLGR